MEPTADDLILAEKVMLLDLRDREGTTVAASMLSYGGAILADLVLLRRIDIEAGKKPFVNIVDPSPTGDPLLDEALEMVKSAKRRARAPIWVSRFARMKDLKHRIARRLCQNGILREDEDRILFLFRRRIYPEINPAPERDLIERLRRVIFTDEPVNDPEIITLLAMAHHSGLLRHTFDRRELKQRRKRIEAAIEVDVAGDATRRAIQAAQAAAMAAITSASTAAVVAG